MSESKTLPLKINDDLNRIPPVDFSFKKLETLQGLSSNDKPRGGRVKFVPSKGPESKFITAGVWLNNNSLQSTEFLSEMIENTLEYPRRLSWLDLSFNRISDITSEISTFTNLKILYLHGNNIQDLQLIMKLKPISSLRTLTLHGNPIDSIPLYRSYVVKIIEQLINLDFTTIAPRERNAPLPAGLADVFNMPFGGPKKKSIKPKAEKSEVPSEELPKKEHQHEEPVAQ